MRNRSAGLFGVEHGDGAAGTTERIRWRTSGVAVALAVLERVPGGKGPFFRRGRWSACQKCGHGIHAEDSEPRQVLRGNLRVLPFVKRQDP